jgi:hypothetical protein
MMVILALSMKEHMVVFQKILGKNYKKTRPGFFEAAIINTIEG